eukprot:SAG31_NODE_1336_length_8738_cov_4.855655_2_plen_173_part_00
MVGCSVSRGCAQSLAVFGHVTSTDGLVSALGINGACSAGHAAPGPDVSTTRHLWTARYQCACRARVAFGARAGRRPSAHAARSPSGSTLAALSRSAVCKLRCRRATARRADARSGGQRRARRPGRRSPKQEGYAVVGWGAGLELVLSCPAAAPDSTLPVVRYSSSSTGRMLP